MTEEQLLGRAIELAVQNAEGGQLPFGALVVRDGRVLSEGVNTALHDSDPTAHAEVAAVRRACAALHTLDLTGATIISSCEPCAICQAVAAAVGIGEIVYAAGRELVPDLGTHGPADDPYSGRFQEALRRVHPSGLRQVRTSDAAAPFERWRALDGGR